MPNRSRAPATLASAVLLAVLVAGCGGGSSEAGPGASPTTASRPSSTAQLKIIDPGSGDELRGPAVQLRVGLSGARIVSFTSIDLKPDEGHLHVLLDGRLISMTLGLEQEISDVVPGSHVIRVEFVASDHAPFNPRVVREVTFEVA